MSFVVRKAASGDEAQLALLHAECFAENWNQHAFAKLLSDKTNFTLIGGTDAGQCESFIVARTAAGEAEILTLATAALARRKGLARALVIATAREAHARGAIEVFLEVAVDNGAACALYRELGFSEAGIRPAYYQGVDGQRTDALTLRARLPLAL